MEVLMGMDKAKEFFKKLSNTELITLCNEIYDWEHGNGDMDKESKLYEIMHFDNSIFSDILMLRDFIINESADRFEKVVKILMLRQTWRFIRR
jgi:hypothetical protein